MKLIPEFIIKGISKLFFSPDITQNYENSRLLKPKEDLEKKIKRVDNNKSEIIPSKDAYYLSIKQREKGEYNVKIEFSTRGIDISKLDKNLKQRITQALKESSEEVKSYNEMVKDIRKNLQVISKYDPVDFQNLKLKQIAQKLPGIMYTTVDCIKKEIKDPIIKKRNEARDQLIEINRGMFIESDKITLNEYEPKVRGLHNCLTAQYHSIYEGIAKACQIAGKEPSESVKISGFRSFIFKQEYPKRELGKIALDKQLELYENFRDIIKNMPPNLDKSKELFGKFNRKYSLLLHYDGLLREYKKNIEVTLDKIY